MGSERSSVEEYARAVARLADPFADRARVLAAMDLDEAGWSALDAAWRTEIGRRSAAGEHSMAEAFSRAFAEERRRLAAQRRSASSSESAPARPEEDLDGTAVAAVVLEPALPFTGSRPPPPAAEVTLQDGDVDQTAVMEDGSGLDITLPFDEDT
jgi:hypothetical protein